jgi:hypothetical protein
VLVLTHHPARRELWTWPTRHTERTCWQTPSLLPAGGPGCVEQVVRLLDRVTVRAVRSWAEFRESQLVLDLEDRLAAVCEIRRVAIALVVLLALLIDGVVEVRTQIGKLLDVVLQRDGEPVGVGQVREARVVEKLIRRCEKPVRFV